MLAIFVISVGDLFAFDDGRRKEVQVQIEKDEFDEKVPEGKCKITGEVYYLGQLQQGAEVCSYKGKECVGTNKKGQFSLLIDTSEINIYATVIGAKPSYLSNYKFGSQHHLVLKFYVNENYSNDAVKKPVVYLYSEERIDARVELITEMDLTFTYPAHEEGWEVSLGPGKDLTVNGKDYPYLFWEAETSKLKYSQKGSALIGEVVKTDSIISYLEGKLDFLGFNNTEKTDFITFWGPLMKSYPYVIAQFDVNEMIDKMAELKITPYPDQMRRVYMLFTGFEDEPQVELVPPSLISDGFVREGFTVFEWGGSEISKEKLYKKL